VSPMLSLWSVARCAAASITSEEVSSSEKAFRQLNVALRALALPCVSAGHSSSPNVCTGNRLFEINRLIAGRASILEAIHIRRWGSFVFLFI